MRIVRNHIIFPKSWVNVKVAPVAIAEAIKARTHTYRWTLLKM